MTTVEVFNVCTHAKDLSGGIGGGIPTACNISPHPTDSKRIATGGGDCNIFVKPLHASLNKTNKKSIFLQLINRYGNLSITFKAEWNKLPN